jgi:DNA-directed RNA polymerase subunit RPC12/RpoP
MAVDVARCAHCGSAIVDPTTQVVHGGQTYCCANCAAALEQTTGGSDPQGPDHAEALRCAHCGSPIVHEEALESRGDLAFCCPNCAAAHDQGERGQRGPAG